MRSAVVAFGVFLLPSTWCRGQAQIVKKNLAAIGIDVEPRFFAPSVAYTRMTTRGEPFDIALTGGFLDFADPAAVLNVLFDGNSIVAEGNTNLSYFNDPFYNQKLEAAAKLAGRARYRTYGRLDVDLARNAAPLVAWGLPQFRAFVSTRVGCPFYRLPTIGVDLVALCPRK
jgi:ABC-type transport system substrate-binding protein